MIDERRSCNVHPLSSLSTQFQQLAMGLTDLDPHAVYIVETVYHPLEVAAMSQLRALQVVLEGSLVCIIIRRIAVDISIQEQSVEGKSPVAWGWSECVVFPTTVVVKRVDGRFILV